MCETCHLAESDMMGLGTGPCRGLRPPTYNIFEQIDALMADLHLARNLLKAPLNAKVEIHIGPAPGIYTAGITAALCSRRSIGAGLLGSMSTLAMARLSSQLM